MTKRPGIDELKLIGLLWRESPASPRSGVSKENVVALAIELADREGLDAVTIRRLAEQVGVSPMALYPHIGGRAELVELMLDRVAGLTYETRAIPNTSNWQKRVIAIAEANWSSFHDHAWLSEFTAGRQIPGPGASAKYETELNALDGLGLSDLEMEHTLTAILSLAQGTARAALAAASSRRQGDDLDRDWWATIGPEIAAAIGDDTRFPTASRVSSALGDETGKANDPEGAFRHGIRLLVEGIAVRLRP